MEPLASSLRHEASNVTNSNMAMAVMAFMAICLCLILFINRFFSSTTSSEPKVHKEIVNHIILWLTIDQFFFFQYFQSRLCATCSTKSMCFNKFAGCRLRHYTFFGYCLEQGFVAYMSITSLLLHKCCNAKLMQSQDNAKDFYDFIRINCNFQPSTNVKQINRQNKYKQ